MAFILCLFITALNFKVSKLTKVDTRISESLLTGVTGRSKCMAIHKWRMYTSRTSDNTKVPDFSFFDLRQIRTWKTEQLAWHWRYWSSFPSASEVRHMYKISGRWFGCGVLCCNQIYLHWMTSTSGLESRDILERNNGSLLKAIQLCTQRYVILC